MGFKISSNLTAWMTLSSIAAIETVQQRKNREHKHSHVTFIFLEAKNPLE